MISARSQAPAAAMQHEHKVKVPSTVLTLKASGKTTAFSAAELAAMPQRSVTLRNGHSNVDETYTGVGFSELLARSGYTLDNGGAARIYHSYVRAEGTDHYYVLCSASELEHNLHTGDALIALTLDGKPLMEDGKFKLVLAGEKRPARWVTNLATLTIVTID